MAADVAGLVDNCWLAFVLADTAAPVWLAAEMLTQLTNSAGCTFPCFCKKHHAQSSSLRRQHFTVIHRVCVMLDPAMLQDVAIKLLLDAARGLAYMHDVDVVHGDVKSRNLLVFWEEDEQSDTEENDNQSDKVMGDSSDAPPAGTTPADAAAAAAGGGSGSQAGDKVLVWGLKWCDFGVSFRAAEAPGGICKTVSSTAKLI